jgi:SAM-dependent methyltransferase
MHQPAIEAGDPFLNHGKYINAANKELFDLYVVESYRAWGREYLERLLSFNYDRVRLSVHPGLWGHVETNREGAITNILDAVDRENRDECVRLFNYHWYPHPKVLQYDAEASSDDDVCQTVDSFAEKWRHILYKDFGERDCERKAYEEVFCSILGAENLDELNALFKDGMNVLNAGCGIAWPEHRFNLNKNVNRYAIDINESAVTISKELTEDMDNVIITQEDLFNLSFDKEFFDIIFAHGVVHHTGDARRAFRVLCEHLKLGGLIGVYVYCVKPFLRELIDRELRKLTTNMSIRECDEFSKQITEFGCSLKEIKEPLRIHRDIPLLNIEAGTYELQPFIYDHLIKCFYNGDFGFEYSTIVNIDWYHPKCVTHHTREEIEFWFKENHIEDVKFIQPKGWEHSGYFVSGRKIAQSF